MLRGVVDRRGYLLRGYTLKSYILRNICCRIYTERYLPFLEGQFLVHLSAVGLDQRNESFLA